MSGPPVVIHVSVNIKNNVEKDKTLLLFFSLSKSPGGHAIFFRCNWVAYLLIDLFYIGVPVVRKVGCSGSVRSGD